MDRCQSLQGQLGLRLIRRTIKIRICVMHTLMWLDNELNQWEVPRAHVPELLLDENLDRAYSHVVAGFGHPPPIVMNGRILRVEHQPARQLHRLTMSAVPAEVSQN